MRPRPWFAIACAVFATDAASADVPLPPGEPSAAVVAAGRELFMLNFARPDDERAARGLGKNGNGLGPLFNEASCVACHSQGGVGGAGGIQRNQHLVGIVTDPPPAMNIDQILKTAREVHPRINDASPIVLVHNSCVADEKTVAAYDSWRDALFASFDGPENPLLPRRRVHNGVSLELVQRNTPALFGMGEIEKLRASGGDGIRRRLADEITAKRPWITGRPPLTNTGEDGWYGWRGQVSSLDRFVRGACAGELGLQVEGARESAMPEFERKSKKRSKPAAAHMDLNEEQTLALTAFVSSLPRPIRQTSGNGGSDTIHNGERLFDAVGCADCHVPDLGSVKGMYSDQLLHDMGEATADLQLPPPLVRTSIIAKTTIQSSALSGYDQWGQSLTQTLGTRTQVSVIPTRRTMEWKTPPLWGVRDSYPYFHDGRAETLRDAIRMHGGEAERSAAAFQQLPEKDQNAVVTFMESLSAPAQADGLAKR